MCVHKRVKDVHPCTAVVLSLVVCREHISIQTLAECTCLIRCLRSSAVHLHD